MARFRNNGSHDPRQWSSRKLLDEIDRIANMRTMSVAFSPDQMDAMTEARKKPGGTFPYETDSNAIRETTRIYRDSWLNPLLNELRSRLIKPTKAEKENV